MSAGGKVLRALTGAALRKNLINSFFYFGASIAQFIVAIVTQPIYSRYLALEDFAIIGYFSAIQALLYSLFNMCLPYYYMARYWRIENGESPEQNMSFILNFLNIANCVVAVISYFLVSAYFDAFNVTFPLMPFLGIVLAHLFIEKYKTYFLIECRARKNGLSFFLLSLLQIVLNTAFSLYFVVTLKYGVTGRMSGMLVGVTVASGVALYLLLSSGKYKFSWKPDRRKIKAALAYCLPLIVASYAYYPLDNVDRLLLEREKNTSEYGYYSIALTVAGFVSTFFIAVYQSFEPDLYRYISQKNYRRYILFAGAYTVLLVVCAMLFIAFSAPVMSFLTSGRYTYSSEYANVFVIGIVFMQIGGFFEQLFTAFGATHFVMWRNVILGVLSTGIYYFAVKQYSFSGASAARVGVAVLYLLLGFVMFYFFRKKRVAQPAHTL